MFANPLENYRLQLKLEEGGGIAATYIKRNAKWHKDLKQCA